MPDPTAALRRSAYLLIGAVAVFIMVAKIVGGENVVEPSRYAPPSPQSFGADRPDKPKRDWPKARPEPSPFYSSNDKSRWATVRTLVEQGTYVVGKRENFRKETGYTDSGVIFDDEYKSLDKVMNPETGEFYSSKPPLFSTALAGEYWVLHRLFGWDFERDRWPVACVILLTVNVLPFAFYLWLLAKLIDQWGSTDFGRLFAFTLAALGTFLLPFGMTLNNHNPAAYCVVFALYPLLRKEPGSGSESPAELAASGFFAGLTACLDLPAAALTAGLLLPLVWVRPVRTLIWFVPAMLVPVAAFFACNYAALSRLTPAYSEFGGPWYDFPGSHWKKLKDAQDGKFVPGLDFAQESKEVYAFHLLVGHHGWFSLTPAFVLSAAGLGMLIWRGRGDGLRVLRRKVGGAVLTPTIVGWITAIVSIVVFGFFVLKTNNYGGSTSGPRWFFWLIPLWVLAAVPAADRIGRWKGGKILAAVLLGFGVLSVFYPACNPWRNPWVQQAGERAGWWSYDVPR